MSAETCQQMVSSSDSFGRAYRCKRKAGHGPDNKLCKQHAIRFTDTEPVAIWYRVNSRYGFEINAVEVFQETKKTLLVQVEYATADIKERTNKATEYHCYFPTWEQAIKFLCSRLEGQRKALAKSEQEFAAASHKQPEVKPRFIAPKRVRI